MKKLLVLLAVVAVIAGVAYKMLTSEVPVEHS